MMQTTSNNIVNKELWTNERHANFLSQMEETFVQRLMHDQNKNLNLRSHHHHHHQRVVDLHRHVPDTSDSTRDLIMKHRSRRLIEANSRMSSRRRLRISLPASSIDDASQDQVVPELGNNKSDKDDWIESLNSYGH